MVRRQPANLSHADLSPPSKRTVAEEANFQIQSSQADSPPTGLEDLKERPSGKLWDPLLGLSESEVEEWERQGDD